MDSTNLDVGQLSMTEVQELLGSLKEQEAALRSKARADLVEKWRRDAEENGFSSIEEVLGTSSRKGGGKKGVPKFRNPDNHDQTWTGRGRAPKWAEAHKAAGTLDEIAI